VDTLAAIHSRQSIGEVSAESVPRAVIEQLLGAAVQAPNHYKVRPWRFAVLTGAGRERLGQVMGAAQARRVADLPAEGSEVTRALPLRAPLVIAVAVDKPSEPRVLEVENICAAAAACQNILLAAQALGLAAKWRTGEWALEPEVKRFLGFDPDQHLIAFLYIGYPLLAPTPPERPSFEDRVSWFE
jgi:nitroreductase